MVIIVAKERTNENKPVLEENEQILHTFANVDLYFGDNSEGRGTLYVTAPNVYWLSDQQSDKGFKIGFRSIMMHAIANDPSSFPQPCIYCQLDSEELSEMRFVPQDAGAVSPIYNAFSESAAMNPEEEQEGEGDFYYNPDEGTSATGFDWDSKLQHPSATTNNNDNGAPCNGMEEDHEEEEEAEEENIADHDGDAPMH
eukprot:GEZU01013888.1.p1 GENE.GEZU01013888.1~~GEZU01013888.1.p1  ORF type:complete len:206 (+),score=57.14 GEZU01013888.1:26-619(+)